MTSLSVVQPGVIEPGVSQPGEDRAGEDRAGEDRAGEMQPTLPRIFRSLFKADLRVQFRRRRSVVISFLVPIVLLVAWHNVAKRVGGEFVLASCISIGLMSVGLMGYASSMALDREKAVFQRLRVTPASTAAIMVSRLLVQLFTIALMTVVVLIGGRVIDQIDVGMAHSLLTLLVAIGGGAVFLALGQAVAGLVSSAESVNAVSRLVYLTLIFGGTFANFGVMGATAKQIALWSPYGTVQTLLQDALHSGAWSSQAWISIVASAGYAALFAAIGIRYFRWNPT